MLNAEKTTNELGKKWAKKKKHQALFVVNVENAFHQMINNGRVKPAETEVFCKLQRWCKNEEEEEKKTSDNNVINIILIRRIILNSSKAKLEAKKDIVERIVNRFYE